MLNKKQERKQIAPESTNKDDEQNYFTEATSPLYPTSLPAWMEGVPSSHALSQQVSSRGASAPFHRRRTHTAQCILQPAFGMVFFYCQPFCEP